MFGHCPLVLKVLKFSDLSCLKGFRMKANPNNSLRASYRYFSPVMTNWQMKDRERQRCVIDKLWIAILHFPITFAEFKIQNWLLTKTKLGGWTNATPIPITASSKNWFTIRQKFTLSWKRSLWQRCGRSSRIYSVYQNISPVELRIYSVLHGGFYSSHTKSWGMSPEMLM